MLKKFVVITYSKNTRLVVRTHRVFKYAKKKKKNSLKMCQNTYESLKTVSKYSK